MIYSACSIKHDNCKDERHVWESPVGGTFSVIWDAINSRQLYCGTVIMITQALKEDTKKFCDQLLPACGQYFFVCVCRFWCFGLGL